MYSRLKKVVCPLVLVFLFGASLGISDIRSAEPVSGPVLNSQEIKFTPSQERLLRLDLAATELSKYYAPKYDPDKDDAEWYAATAWLNRRCLQEMSDLTQRMDAEEVRDVIGRSELLPPKFWGRVLGAYGPEFAKGEYLRFLKFKLHSADEEFRTVCTFAHTTPEAYHAPAHMMAFFDGFNPLSTAQAKNSSGK